MSITDQFRAWKPKLGVAFWAVVSVSLLLVTIATATSGFSGLLIMVGLIALISAAYAFITGRHSWASIPGRKSAAVVGAVAILLLGTGSAVAGQPASDVAPLASVSSPTPSAAAPQPVQEAVVATAALPFASQSIDDPNMAVGTQAVTTAGVPGTETTTYLVTYLDGVEVERVTQSKVVTIAPVDQITSIGTKAPQVVAPPAPPAATCDPNYSGGCVPISSDVDCGGGSGNGPGYVWGAVRIVGSDIYDLDRDGDGYGCE